jgi:thioredoxin-like negative regulator of GroEL
MPLTEQSDRGGGELSDLQYPKVLLPAERSRAKAMVAVLPKPLNQQVLDEWAGIVIAGEIRASSLGCLRALVRRVQQGSFAPERALRVAQARKVRKRAEAAPEQVVLPEPPPIDEDNPLVRRLMNIAQHSSEK